ncbi:MAG: iron ABC transporter permease [Pseudomonadota bacterium]
MKLVQSINVWTIGSLLAALFVSMPIIAVLSSLFAGGTDNQAWLATLPVYIGNTLALMVLVGVISSVIGVSTAWLVTAASFPGRRLLSWLLVLPLATPAYIVAYFYTDLLAYAGPVQTAIRSAFEVRSGDYWFPAIRSLPGAAIILGVVLYPYIYLLARHAFSAQSVSQLHAARSLGMSPWAAFFRIVLPGARPAIAGGLTLVLMETIADFGVVEYFAIPTFSTGIFRVWFAMGDQISAMKLAGFMLLFVIVLLALEAYSRRGAVISDDRLSAGPPPFVLSRTHGVFAIAICLAPVLLGFVIPFAGLLQLSVAHGDHQDFATLALYMRNSVSVAVITAMVAVMLALLLVYGRRQMSARAGGARMQEASTRIATLGYALPGTLLAVGLLGPLGALDQSLTRFSRNVLGLEHGLLLTGSIALLVYALVVRFLTVSYNSVSTGMMKVSGSMDAAARSLGAAPSRLLTRIHLPLLGPSLTAAAALVFIDVMRELPATLILRPFNFETLATRVYRLASDERLAEASTAALIIVLLGLAPALFLNRART